MERFKPNPGKTSSFIRHQKRKSEQLSSKENSYCLGSSRPLTSSNSSIKPVVIIKHQVQRTKSGGNASINLDLSKVHSVQIQNIKNYSARNIEHRRANSIYLGLKAKGDSGTDRSKRDALSGDRKLDNAPEIGSAGNNRFWERLGLAEQKLNYFYNCQKRY